MFDGFLILNKTKGSTSHDCVKKVRKLLEIKKVGHTGTLDPQVTGVLPMAIGNATRFIQYLPQDKTYIGTIKLGISTDTDDIHGEIINKRDWPKLSFEDLDRYLSQFRGIIKQVPPKLSSVHINGERAYKKFLRNEDFNLSPREVEIKELILKKWDPNEGIIDINVKCSSGTYIRSIARDIGELLDSKGCLLSLKRTEAAGFKIETSIGFDALENIKKDFYQYIIPTNQAINHLSTLILKTEEEISYWKTGRKIELKSGDISFNKEFESKDPVKVISIDQELLGIGYLIIEDRNFLRPKLVLNAI